MTIQCWKFINNSNRLMKSSVGKLL